MNVAIGSKSMAIVFLPLLNASIVVTPLPTKGSRIEKMRISSKSPYISRISQRSFFTISSAFVGSTFSVISFFGVRSLSLTACFRRFMLQYSALSDISMNLSMSKISWGICFHTSANLLACYILFVSVASIVV